MYHVVRCLISPLTLSAFEFLPQYFQLVNVAIANALQLEGARVTPVLSRVNEVMPSLKSMNLSIGSCSASFLRCLSEVSVAECGFVLFVV